MGSRLDCKKELFYSYLAGFLDGDGCIAIKFESSKTNKLGYRARVRVSFTQHRLRRSVLDFFHKNIKSGVVSEYDHNNMAEYVIHDQKIVKELLINIKPYVYVKPKQLNLALKLLILKESGYSKSSIKQMFNIYKEVGSLNHYQKKSNLTP